MFDWGDFLLSIFGSLSDWRPESFRQFVGLACLLAALLLAVGLGAAVWMGQPFSPVGWYLTGVAILLVMMAIFCFVVGK